MISTYLSNQASSAHTELFEAGLLDGATGIAHPVTPSSLMRVAGGCGVSVV